MNASRSSPLHDETSSAVIAAAIEVHRALGPGFFESVYEEALVMELETRGVMVRRQVTIPILFKGREVGTNRLDLLVEERLVVELKAVAAIEPVHLAQVRSYLKAGVLDVGLLINFNVVQLRQGIRRVRFAS